MASVTDDARKPPRNGLAEQIGRRLTAMRNILLCIWGLLLCLVMFGQLGLGAALIAALASLLVMAFVPVDKHPVATQDTVSTTAPVAIAALADVELDSDIRDVDADQSLQALLQAVPSPIALIDDEANVVAANSVFSDAFGQDVVDTSAFIRFRSPDVHNVINAAIAEGKSNTAEFADKGQVGRWFEVSVVPLGMTRKGENRCLLYFRDLSEARRLEKMRTDFVGNASHELRTPLASLKGYLETLAGAARNDPEARERFIGIMLEQAERMERLIDDLLSLSRFETGMGRAAFEPIDLSDTLFHVRSALRPMAEKYGATLDFDDEALLSEALTVNGSRDELIQLFENLVENAIKYGGAGTAIKVGVEAVKEYDRGIYKVTVSDNGPGIPPEHIPRLTERFYRVDVQTSREKQGTGLGLAIVKHILTRHDGSLSVKSEVSKGSDFTVTIPQSAA